MNENDEAKQIFGTEELDEGKLFIEVPAEQKTHYQEKIPSGYDPMGEIYLRDGEVLSPKFLAGNAEVDKH